MWTCCGAAGCTCGHFEEELVELDGHVEHEELGEQDKDVEQVNKEEQVGQDGHKSQEKAEKQGAGGSDFRVIMWNRKIEKRRRSSRSRGQDIKERVESNKN